MKSRMVRRYYCDFCKKSGQSSYRIRQHEIGCCMNPSRICRTCLNFGLPQARSIDLSNAINSNGIEAVRVIANGCPSCVLSAILQTQRGKTNDERFWVEFDYKAEQAAFFNSKFPETVNHDL